MRTPRESFEAIALMMERGMAEADPRDARIAMIQAHTSAVIQASRLRKEEAYGERIAAMFRGEALH